MGKLTTHILDTAKGCPAAGVQIDLYFHHPHSRQWVKSVYSNADGRCDAPLVEGDQFIIGQWELVFHMGAYFRVQGAVLSEPPFLDRVPLLFAIADANAHYHVPLLASPWSYSTYRGS